MDSIKRHEIETHKFLSTVWNLNWLDILQVNITANMRSIFAVKVLLHYVVSHQKSRSLQKSWKKSLLKIKNTTVWQEKGWYKPKKINGRISRFIICYEATGLTGLGFNEQMCSRQVLHSHTLLHLPQSRCHTSCPPPGPSCWACCRDTCPLLSGNSCPGLVCCIGWKHVGMDAWKGIFSFHFRGAEFAKNRFH